MDTTVLHRGVFILVVILVEGQYNNLYLCADRKGKEILSGTERKDMELPVVAVASIRRNGHGNV